MKLLVTDSQGETDDVYPNEYMRYISNHVPVTLRITDEDDDNTPAGDWGV